MVTFQKKYKCEILKKGSQVFELILLEISFVNILKHYFVFITNNKKKYVLVKLETLYLTNHFIKFTIF